MSSDDIYYSELQARHLYDGMEEDLCTGEELLIPGPAGNIEVLTSCPECYIGSSPIAVICHPHPLYGGNMRNKVVHILAESFNSMGLRAVTFNFRGVEKSTGRYDRGVGETEDLKAVVDYFRKRHPEAPLWLAGFSFGAYVALRAHQQLDAERLLLVAPPVGLFDFDDLPEVTIPWMVIQGGKDEVVAPAAVSSWLQQRRHRPVLRWMADADHFFHGRLNRLRESVVKLWSDALPDAKES